MLRDHGQATCIECGAESARRLPARFPHICERCLFPSQAQNAQMLSDLYARIPHSKVSTPKGWQDGN